MQPSQIFRFRLWHLFVAVFVVCVSLWGITRWGVRFAEIEVLRFDTALVPRDVDEPNWVAQQEILLVEFTYLQPDSRRHLTNRLFMHPVIAKKTFEIGTILTFEYREASLFWLKPKNPDDIAIKMLGIESQWIEEIITESGDQTVE